MVLLLRAFGVISTVFGAIMLIATLIKPPSDFSYTIFWIVSAIAWPALWFWLAHKAAVRRRARIEQMLNGPCVNCGHNSNPGYRVCSSCGRVRHPGLANA